MSFLLRNTRKEHLANPRWANSAFIVEAIVLLVFLIASATVFMQLFSAATVRSDESGATTAAVAAASATAERFTANPASVQEITEFDDLVVVCETNSTKRAGGTMYYADIAVYRSDEVAEGGPTAGLVASRQGAVYALSTATYVSEVSG